ncbi:MAG: bifunctional phosphoribosyl-AMP cyclohydrolase/phosphoribosyl-ATP diphosphatase HisIE [Clostridia bacterium]|nr:bifunctional phosphoribosyl-AMP cyclohydrolase/phosphoribosyl-ATP diphosphatase HisIE [Clostridia bacterium]
MINDNVGEDFLSNLKFDHKGLIPAVIQDVSTGKVLMLAYMNQEALQRTLKTKRTWFYSRSRQKLWNKGETSGNYQEVVQISYDCDADALLIKVKQHGPACHTGKYSCFHNIALERGDSKEIGTKENIVEELYKVIQGRFKERPEGSYTTYLFNEGQDKILKKIGEEAAEIIIGSKNHSREEVIYEMGDLLYHSLVLLVYHDIKPYEILNELAKRRLKGNK